MANQDSWSHRFQNLNFQLPDDGISISPATSQRLMQRGNVTRIVGANRESHSDGASRDSTQILAARYNHAQAAVISPPSVDLATRQRFLADPASTTIPITTHTY